MTLFSFVMMQFSIFEKSVSVAGRLAGFFQYPNTYALFMLICLVIAVDKLNWDKIDWLWCAYAGIAVFGIIMSGSRTVLLLMLVLGAWYCVKRKLPGKVLLMAAGGCAVLVVLLWSTGVGKEVLIRVFSTNGSTFWGRLLYMKDAAGMILTHPFGLGYYGYHYLQTSCQTGVYSVVSVHNELLQLLLDVGILPAILFYGMLVKSCISKNVSGRNRLLLLIVILHSLFDYDFQFLVIGMVVILLLEDENVKEIPISWFTRICSLFAAIGVMATNKWIGNYYVDNTGCWTKTRVTAQWMVSGNRWWYRHSDGSYACNGWENIGENDYLFDANGWMLTGWQIVNGKWYYLESSGAKATNKWVNGNYYVDADGVWNPDKK